MARSADTVAFPAAYRLARAISPAAWPVASPCPTSTSPVATAMIAIDTHVSDRRRTARTLRAAAAPPTATTSMVPSSLNGASVPVISATTNTMKSAKRASHRTPTGRAMKAIGSHSGASAFREIAAAAPK